MTRSKRPPDFEKSLAELEALVERLEGGELPLEESLKAFERGVALTRECQVALEAAQARVDTGLRAWNSISSPMLGPCRLSVQGATGRVPPPSGEPLAPSRPQRRLPCHAA